MISKSKIKKITKQKIKQFSNKKRLPYEHFEEEWDNSSKPIVFAFGINTWKRKIIKDYFPEYRIGFIFGKTNMASVKYYTNKYNVNHFLVWGYKESEEINNFAISNNIKIIRIEDGFIRSIGLGSNHTPPLSLAVDNTGLYFNSRCPSDLEIMLNEYNFEGNDDLLNKAESALNNIIKYKISKYNEVVNLCPQEIHTPKKRKRVLVIGQVEDDASILYGMSRQMKSYDLVMLAVSENPGAEILYKPHPDVLKKYEENKNEYNKIKKVATIIEKPMHLIDAFTEVDHVYTFTSLAGFEALIRGIKVTCLGMPFYAGWGLTDDRQKCERRSRKLSVKQLFALAYIKYPKYFSVKYNTIVDINNVIEEIIEGKNALIYQQSIYYKEINDYSKAIFYAEQLVEYSNKKIDAKKYLLELYELCSLTEKAKELYKDLLETSEVEDIYKKNIIKKLEKIDHLSNKYSQYAGTNEQTSFPFYTQGDWSDDNKPIALLIGVSFWKRKNLHLFLPDYRVAFAGTKIKAGKLKKLLSSERQDMIGVWGYKEDESIRLYCKENKIKLMRLEDGFVQSVGVGKHGSAPASVIMDSRRLYFDSSDPSDLEVLLENYDFNNNPEILERAKNGIEIIKNLGITKYNQKDVRGAEEIYGVKSKKRILVIGQVENDASIQYGANRRITNNDLVWTAYKENPDAEIIYKPHPEVILGTREMYSDPKDVEAIAKVIREPLSLAESFKTIDHVYTITSLSGFEALIRGIPVTCLGMPFYAGWGLTEDRQISILRRKRRLTIEQLFAGAYLLYPRYLDEFTGELTTFEKVVENLYKKLSNLPLEQKSQKHLDKSQNLMTRFNDNLAKRKPDAERADIYYEMAKIKLENGQYDSELDYYMKKSFEEVNNWKAYQLRIDYLYKTKGITQELMKIIDHYLLMNKKITASELIKLACIFNDAGKYIQSINLYKEAIKKDSTIYYKVRNLALNSLLFERDPEIEGVSKEEYLIYKKILENRSRIENLIIESQGDICFVGNDLCPKDHNVGKVIDTHKLVIRFNDFDTTFPVANNYGLKTDIWVRVPLYDSIKRKDTSKIKAIVFSDENMLFGSLNGQDPYTEFLNQDLTLGIIPSEIYYDLYEKLKAPPSIAITFIYWVYKLTGYVNQEKIYGLSYIDNDFYVDEEYNEKNGKHDWEKEKNLLKKISNNNRILELKGWC